jgi:ABC-2 type transport system permease protein
MKAIGALLRVSWLSASSYRLGLVISIVGFIAGFVPIFFIASALQPIVQDSIALESRDYFPFLVVGISSIAVITAAATALPGAIGSSIASGTFEALLSTRVPISSIVMGLSVYPLLWNLLRMVLLLILLAVIGLQVFWGGALLAALVILLLVAAYFAVALISASLILVFRTSGPLTIGVISISGLLGGVYYSTSVIPSWIQQLSALVPLTYGLRALRRVLLTGASFSEVWTDVAMLSLFAGVLLAAGAFSFAAALQHSRRAGTLAQY